MHLEFNYFGSVISFSRTNYNSEKRLSPEHNIRVLEYWRSIELKLKSMDLNSMLEIILIYVETKIKLQYFRTLACGLLLIEMRLIKHFIIVFNLSPRHSVY
jgi:hypothetical protein